MEKIKIEGRIKAITYPKTKHNAGDWAVFYVMPLEIVSGKIKEETKKSGYICCSGNAPELNIGADYEIEAELVKNDKYGYQYKILLMNEKLNLKTREEKYVFFSHFVSEKIVDGLFRKFNDPLEIVKNGDVNALCQVSGIGPVVANRIIQRYMGAAGIGNAIVALKEFDLTEKMIYKLAAQYGSADILIAKVKENPYILIKDCNGVGFKKADKVAINGGMPLNDPRRANAFIDFYFEDLADGKGDTWVNPVDLVTDAVDILKGSDINIIKNEVNRKIQSGDLTYKVIDGKKRLSKTQFFDVEQNVCNELKRIDSSYSRCVDNYVIDDCIAKCQAKVGYEYTDEQKNAIYGIVNGRGVSILTGLGGTGKSSIIYAIVSSFKAKFCSVAQCALSGRAALNLSELTGVEGKTLHRLLGWNGEGFTYSDYNPLPYDVIIVDELSMVGAEIFLKLISAVRDGCKLIVVGDTGQLESIGMGNCLHDMIQSGAFQHFELTKIHRQAQKSGIILDSHKVYNKEQIIPNGFYGEVIHGELEDCKIVSSEDAENTANLAIREYCNLVLGKNDKADNDMVDQITVVTMKKTIGQCSARVLNQKIQYLLGKSGSFISHHYKENGTEWDINFYVGDRVLVKKNNYRTLDISGNTEPIYNGNIGIIQEIRDKSLIVKFRQGTVVVDKLDDLALGYAITTHSAQGSGFNYVIAVCDPSAYVLLSKEMLYTQLSRAKKWCCLVGPVQTIRSAVGKSGVRSKKTWLEWMLCEENEL